MSRLSVGHRIRIMDIFKEEHEGVIQGWEEGGFWVLSNGSEALFRIRTASIVWIRGPLKA